MTMKALAICLLGGVVDGLLGLAFGGLVAMWAALPLGILFGALSARFG